MHFTHLCFELHLTLITFTLQTHFAPQHIKPHTTTHAHHLSWYTIFSTLDVSDLTIDSSDPTMAQSTSANTQLNIRNTSTTSKHPPAPIGAGFLHGSHKDMKEHEGMKALIRAACPENLLGSQCKRANCQGLALCGKFNSENQVSNVTEQVGSLLICY